MAYPTSYRSGAASPQPARQGFWRDESGYARFPDRGTWGNPTRPTGDPTPPPRPFSRPPPPTPLIPPDPATRPQQDIPWFERSRNRVRGFRIPLGGALGVGAAILGASEMLWPGDQWRFPHVPPPAGWSHPCGPLGWPGPPYANAIRVVFAGGICTTPGCGTGNQSLGGAAYLPDANTRCIRYFYAPKMDVLPAIRAYLSDQYTANPAPGNIRVMSGYPAPISSQWAPFLPPGLRADVIAHPNTLWEIPATGTDPAPFSPVRGDTAPEPENAPEPAPRPSHGGLSFQPSYPEIRTPPREREQKVDPRLGAAYRFLGSLGTWTHFVNALHKSLPPKYSHRRRTLKQKLQDLYQHWDEVDLERAIRHLFQYWVRYKAAGWAYGRAQRYLVEALGPRRGYEVYRALVRAGAL